MRIHVDVLRHVLHWHVAAGVYHAIRIWSLARNMRDVTLFVVRHVRSLSHLTPIVTICLRWHGLVGVRSIAVGVGVVGGCWEVVVVLCSIHVSARQTVSRCDGGDRCPRNIRRSIGTEGTARQGRGDGSSVHAALACVTAGHDRVNSVS